MPQQPPSSAPRDNPFWTYRDPQSGRWVTLMTAEQCQQLGQQVFKPRNSQIPFSAAETSEASADSET
jgi:hypothetical protein